MKPTSRARRVRRLGVAFSLLLCGIAFAHPDEFDIVVYGGTSGGVTAAVQGARLGKKVALVSPTTHIGGLSASGLGWTDLGDIGILGGLSREFYHRIYLHYQAQPNWNSIKGMGGQGGAAFNTTYQTGSIFEPKVAEAVFNAMLNEAGVSVFTGRLDLQSGVQMNGLRITGLRMEDGQVYRGKMFVDACYEGDVMAGAGVSFTIGRESNATYGETINGVQPGGKHQMPNGVDPYVEKGNPASGLLPGIESTPLEPTGTGDHRLQAFCFRMVLTKAADRIPITAPPNYNEQDFELVLRAVEAGQRTFFKEDKMPNGKTDSNNTGGVSCDYIGRNYGPGWNWATLSHQQRDALAKEHEYWQRGLVYVLQNHPRVLALVPGGIQPGWGLPRDEFKDNGHWAFQLYVREARRMVSDYVMTEQNCKGSKVAPDSVGMGAYTMDSHNVRRYVSGGMVKNEGDVQVGSKTYPISYRSIVPKTGECENLFVPWCLSSSHMAFGSIRMEPVFMTLGQSSATAAAMAIDGNLSVQEVPYEKLAMKLRADGQALTLENTSATSDPIEVDNPAATVTPTDGWVTSTSISGFIGSDYLSDDNSGKGTKSIRYIPNLPSAGNYEVQIRWTSNPNRATNVPLKITHRNGVGSTTINQQTGGGAWYSLGTFPFEAGTSGNLLLETTNTNGYVVADAVRWLPPVTTRVGVASFVPSVVRGASTGGGFVVSRSGSITNSLSVRLDIGGSAGTSAVSPAIPTSVVIPANAREKEISWLALKGTQPLGTKTLVVSITPDAAYEIGTLSSATATIVDPPFDAWRFSRFNASQLSNADISGAGADPDGNGQSNLLDFFTGGDGSRPSLLSHDGKLYLSFLRHQDANGVKMKVWESGDLTDWQLTPAPDVPELYESQGAFRRIGLPVRASGPFADGRRFFQLRIEN